MLCFALDYESEQRRMDAAIKSRLSQYACEMFSGVPEEWDHFVENHAAGTYFQHGSWLRAFVSRDTLLETILIRRGSEVVGGGGILFQHVPYLGLKSELPGGLLCREDVFSEYEAISTLLSCLTEACKKRKCVLADLHLRIPAYDASGQSHAENSVLGNALSSSGYIRMPKSSGTYIQHIDLEDDALLNGFKKNVRRDVRRAQREEVRVHVAADADMLDDFYINYQMLFQRKGLQGVPRSIFVEGAQKAMEKGHVRLFYSSCRNVVLNYALVSTIGIPRYLYGASTAAALDSRYPPGGQILQYEMMRWLRDQGKRQYDFGGSPGPIPDPAHPNYGVWRFKASFQGCYVEHYGHWSQVFKPLQYALWKRAIVPCSTLVNKIRN